MKTNSRFFLCSINDLVTFANACPLHFKLWYTLDIKVVTPRNEVPLWRLFIFCLLVRYLLIMEKLEKLAAWAYLNAIVVNLVKLTWFFLSDAACWCGFVYAWSVLGIPTASCDNRHQASWHTCYKALQASYRDFYPSPRFWGWLSILVISQPNSPQICFMGL